MKRLSARLAAFSLLFFCAALVHAQQKPPKIKTSAISVAMIHSEEIKLPAEFQVSLYEDLIQQLQKNGGIPHVYREGDRNSSTAPDLVTLHSTIRGFKKGSEFLRQVTSVSGQTSIKVHCQFTDKDGKSLLEQDINGKVWFFGENRKATFDFAKKAAKMTRQSFSPATGT
jgi:hypothetical protein